MKNNIRNIFSVILVCCFCIFSAEEISAQSSSSSPSLLSSSSSWEPSPWYLGIKGGIPFGVSTFSSFGNDKTRLGWSGGVYGGYNINLIFSVEAFYSKGEISGMSVQDDFGYYISDDGEFSFNDDTGSSYNDIYSTASMQRYGLQWNMDIIQLLYLDDEINFKIVLSPSVSAISTKATIKEIENDNVVLKGKNNLNPAIGSDLSFGYKLSKHLNAQIYTSFSWVFGDRIDGMPQHLYDDNFIMEFGIKCAWTFGKKREKAKINNLSSDSEDSGINYNADKIKKIEPATIVTSLPKNNVSTSVTGKDSILLSKKEIGMPDLIIYSSFNEYFIDYRYIYSMKEIAEKLESDKTLKLYIIGWSDIPEIEKTGHNIAEIRADYVKTWFINQGIDRERIYVNENIVNLEKSDLEKNDTRKTEIRIIK